MAIIAGKIWTISLYNQHLLVITLMAVAFSSGYPAHSLGFPKKLQPDRRLVGEYHFGTALMA